MLGHVRLFLFIIFFSLLNQIRRTRFRISSSPGVRTSSVLTPSTDVYFRFVKDREVRPSKLTVSWYAAVVLTLEFSFFFRWTKNGKVVFANFTGCDHTNDSIVASPRILARKHECAHGHARIDHAVAIVTSWTRTSPVFDECLYPASPVILRSDINTRAFLAWGRISNIVHSFYKKLLKH